MPSYVIVKNSVRGAEQFESRPSVTIDRFFRITKLTFLDKVVWVYIPNLIIVVTQRAKFFDLDHRLYTTSLITWMKFSKVMLYEV